MHTVGFENKHVCSKPTPSTGTLHKDKDGEEWKDNWNWRLAIGILNYLAHATRPDVTMVVHQFATFCKNPKLSHEKSVNRIFKHLLGTRHMCIQAKTNVEAGLLAHAD